MKKYIHIVFILFVALAFAACGENKNNSHEGHDHGEEQGEQSDHDDYESHEGGDHEEHEEGLHLTKAQAKTIGLELGDFSEIKVNDFVKATGTLGLPPNGYASVSAKSEGIIKGSKVFVEGNAVKKGDVIAYIENTEFIVKQQEYLEAKASWNYKKLELERQRTLVEANAGVPKNLQNAEAEAAILEAKVQGLAKQLSYLGISIKNLTPSNIKQHIPIVAPMSGFISSINLHSGMYVQPSIPLMEIISDDHLHLELDVFEKDIARVAIGQKISYTLPALGDKVYEGEVSIIGKEFNAQSKTIRVHGHLEGERPLFLKDLFINAKIWLNDNTVTALPEKAVISNGESTFIYAAKNNLDADEIEFIQIPVIAETTQNGYTAVKLLEEIPKGMAIVVKGAYYVYAQSQAGELEHEH